MKTITDNVLDIERTIEDALEANSVSEVRIEKSIVRVEIANPRAFVRLFPKREMWEVEKNDNKYPAYTITVTDAPYVYEVFVGSQSDFDEFCEVYDYEYMENENPDEVENAETL